MVDMPAAGADRPAPALVGRDAEMALLARAFERARSGRPTVVLVVGDAGIGKSSLISAVVGPDDGSPADHVLVTGSGDEAEADLDYGVLEQLARGFPDAGRDPETGAALLPRPGAEPHRVGAAVLRLVDASTLDQPLVVVIDDAQWADRVSLEALTFAARRLRADTVLLCVGCRPDGVDRLPPGLVRLADEAGSRIELGPLDMAAVADLARRALGRPLPPAAAQRLCDHTAGNPLHTRTLLGELPYDALARRETLPAPRSYAGLVLSLVAACSPPAQDMLMALAVLGVRAPLAEVAAVAGVDQPLEVVDELVARGLAQVVSTPTGRVLAFPHGLVHASVADDLSPSRRAALHAAAATVTTGDEALRHRLAAAHGPEPELVDAARRSARNHLATGARTTAARILLDAAPLAATPADSQHLVAIAAGYLVVAGQPLGPLADQMTEMTELTGCAHRSFVLGRLALGRGALAEASRLLARAGDQVGAEPETADLAGPVSDMLAILALHEWRLDDVIAVARRSLASGTNSTMSATLLGHGLALQGSFDEAIEEMSALLADGNPPNVALDGRLGRGITRIWSNDLEGAERDLAEAAATVGDIGTFLTGANVRSYRAELARHHVEAAQAGATASPLMPARLWAAHAGFRLAAAGGDHAEVAAAGDRMVAEGWDAVPEGIHHWRATYVESLVAVGRLDDAAGVAEALTAAAAAVPGDESVAADAARARGIAAAARGDTAAADDAFAAGLELDPDRSRPFERALLELAAGAHQRRTGRRRAAAELLARAGERLDALGAVPWYDRAAREIERCGLHPKRRSEAHDPELTAQERLVAHLVAGGRTNREVASELVISIKTVEHHLSRVYTKLGLRSRTELAARMAPG